MRGGSEARDEVYAARRRAMVAEVAEMAESVKSGEFSTLSRPVLAALGRVPRHLFVPEEERDFAYLNRPLPIGQGQTISQPYIVALMTDMLALAPGQRVLEIGTGCGYQTAVLAEMGVEVYTVEIVASLAAQAAFLLETLGYRNVHARQGDGSLGWPEHAPYDSIIVTAGAIHMPQALLDQLKPGGRMAVPIGEAYVAQELLLVTKDADDMLHTREVLPVRFVPLTGDY